MKRFLLGCLGCLGLSLSACFSHDGAMFDINRNNLNDEIDACAKTRAVQCRELGDDYGGFSQRSRQSDWQQPHDLALAKRAYLMGCEAGDGLACRALVEHRLFANDEEERRFHTLSSYYGQEVRSPAELQAEEEKDREALEKKEKQLAQIRKEEREDRDRQMQNVGTALQNTLNQINTGGQGAGADPAGGGAGAKKDPCAPCLHFAGEVRSACAADSMSRPCYIKNAEMRECMANQAVAPGCVKDPAAEMREAGRLRRAADELTPARRR